jgi:hypothetical protein
VNSAVTEVSVLVPTLVITRLWPLLTVVMIVVYSWVDVPKRVLMVVVGVGVLLGAGASPVGVLEVGGSDVGVLPPGVVSGGGVAEGDGVG